MNELPNFDAEQSNPVVGEQPPKKRRKPTRRQQIPVKQAVPKKRRGRPPGAKNKKPVYKTAFAVCKARGEVGPRNKFKPGATVVFAESDKLTGSEMEVVLGMLQTLGSFDKDAKQRILARVRLLV